MLMQLKKTFYKNHNNSHLKPWQPMIVRDEPGRYSIKEGLGIDFRRGKRPPNSIAFEILLGPKLFWL